MADDADLAGDLMQDQIERTLAARQVTAVPPGPAQCDECDNPMPDARRAHGFRICVECRRVQEARR